jgi:hypothetical protein
VIPDQLLKYWIQVSVTDPKKFEKDGSFSKNLSFSLKAWNHNMEKPKSGLHPVIPLNNGQNPEVSRIARRTQRQGGGRSQFRNCVLHLLNFLNILG